VPLVLIVPLVLFVGIAMILILRRVVHRRVKMAPGTDPGAREGQSRQPRSRRSWASAMAARRS
jgi:hypothetical protein